MLLLQTSTPLLLPSQVLGTSSTAITSRAAGSIMPVPHVWGKGPPIHGVEPSTCAEQHGEDKWAGPHQHVFSYSHQLVSSDLI